MVQTGDNQHVRVDVIEAHHVLAAMQDLKWAPGEKPPALVPIQARLRKIFLNGGDTKRLSGLREEAIVLAGSATGYNSETTPAEAAQGAVLPEALDLRLAECAAAIGVSLTSLHTDLATYLGSYQAEKDRDAAIRVEASVKSADERIAAAEYELNIALATCDDSAVSINDLTQAVAEAQSAAAAATGKAEAIAGELTAARSQLFSLESTLEASRDAAATATGKADAVQAELAARTARIIELEAALVATQAALATMKVQLESAELELTTRDSRLVDRDARIEGLIEAEAKAAGRAEAFKHELDARDIKLAEAESALLKVMAASAAATSRSELLDAETSTLRQRITVLENERHALPFAGGDTGAKQAEPEGRRGKKRPAGGDS